jgi:hypothetical protein
MMQVHQLDRNLLLDRKNKRHDFLYQQSPHITDRSAPSHNIVSCSTMLYTRHIQRKVANINLTWMIEIHPDKN